jgi:hypothetical protein
MQLTIMFVTIVLLLTIVAWSKWLIADRRSLIGTRKVLFICGLSIATLALFEYFFFGLHIYRIGGFGDNFSAMLIWARPGLWGSFIALVLVIAGRGTSRLFGIAASSLLLIFWLIPIWAM